MQLSAEVAADHARTAVFDAEILSLQRRLGAAQAKIAVSATTPATSSTTYGPFSVTGKDVYLTGYNLPFQLERHRQDRIGRGVRVFGRGA